MAEAIAGMAEAVRVVVAAMAAEMVAVSFRVRTRVCLRALRHDSSDPPFPCFFRPYPLSSLFSPSAGKGRGGNDDRRSQR